MVPLKPFTYWVACLHIWLLLNFGNAVEFAGIVSGKVHKFKEGKKSSVVSKKKNDGGCDRILLLVCAWVILPFQFSVQIL